MSRLSVSTVVTNILMEAAQGGEETDSIFLWLDGEKNDSSQPVFFHLCSSCVFLKLHLLQGKGLWNLPVQNRIVLARNFGK